MIALDKSTVKVQKLMENVQRHHISCAHCFKFDSTKSLSVGDKVNQGEHKVLDNLQCTTLSIRFIPSFWRMKITVVSSSCGQS